MPTVALIGTGYMARTHADAYEALGDVTVRYVVSRDPQRAQPLADKLHAKPTDDLQAVLRDDAVDAVDICTPSDLHRDSAIAALEAGKHVLVEKPVALSLADCDAMIAAAAAGDRILMVGLVLRHWPEYVQALETIRSGEAGAPSYVAAQRLSLTPDWNAWMADRRRTGGVAVDMLCHDFDIACAILGDPVSVSARRVGDSEHMMAVTEHRHGESVVEGSASMPAGFPFTSALRVGCDKAALEYLFRAAKADDGGNIGDGLASEGLVSYAASGTQRTIAVRAADPYTEQLRHFVTCLADGSTPTRGTAQQARTALALALAANQSADQGGARVTVSL